MNSVWATAHAARNNAAWCDRICRSHGLPGMFHESYWFNTAAAPRLYPNMVTLSEGRPAIAAQMERIERAIGEEGLPATWSIKDSFSSLELGTLGFAPLFEANWIWRQPLTEGEDPTTDTAWSRITEAVELAQWENAWADACGPDDGGRTFRNSLIGQPGVAIIAASRNGRIAGGAVANLAEGVVGLSNVFGRPEEQEALWPRAVATVCAIFPGMPLVGYEQGAPLMHAKSAGFEALRPLTVWALRG
jgi:hypothetical protein